MGFKPEVERALSLTGVSNEAITRCYDSYNEWRLAICQTAPLAEDLNASDISALTSRQDHREGEDWEDYRARVTAKEAETNESGNPFMPSWNIKADGVATQWVNDVFGDALEIDDKAKEAINKVLRDACPFELELGRAMMIRGCLSGYPLAFESILRAIRNTLPLFVSQAGSGDNAEWRWGKAVPLLAAFGHKGFQYLARALAAEDHWDHFASLDAEAWVDQVIACHAVSGFPVALLRVDMLDMYYALRAHVPIPPRWWKALAILHVFKYARVIPGHRPKIFVAYRGCCSLLPVPRECLAQPITSTANKDLFKDLARALKLPCASGKDADEYERLGSEILGSLILNWLPQTTSIERCHDFIIPQGVRLSVAPQVSKSYSWLNPGVVVDDVGIIDRDTGEVSFDEPVQSADVLTYDWPQEHLEPEKRANWRSMIPSRVEPRRPSFFYGLYVKNWNRLGHPRAVNALLDAVVLTAIFRNELAGSELGSLLSNEYPLISVYPMEGTAEGTTNQGKTNLARLIGMTYQPRIQVSMMKTGDSAPDQRTLAEGIRTAGSAIVDEFLLPTSSNHFLSKQGIQILATGGEANVGRAGENASGLRLRFPLIVIAKISAFPPDMRNRQLALFLDKVTDATRLPDEQLALLMTARIPYLARLCALTWANKTNFVQRARALKPAGTIWRFNAHLAIAKMLIEEEGGTIEEIRDYLRASELQCDRQQDLAEESGLADDVGVTTSFSFKYFWDQMHSETADLLLAKARGDGLTPTELLRDVIEDSGKRTLPSTLREYRMKERVASSKVLAELGKDEWSRLGITIHRDYGYKDEKGRAKAWIRISKTTEK